MKLKIKTMLLKIKYYLPLKNKMSFHLDRVLLIDFKKHDYIQGVLFD